MIAAVADVDDVKALQAAAEDVDPQMVSLVLAGVGVASFEAVPRSALASVCSSLRACSRSWPPLPLTSPLDRLR